MRDNNKLNSKETIPSALAANKALEEALHVGSRNQYSKIKEALANGADLTQIDKKVIAKNITTLLVYSNLLLSNKTAHIYLEAAICFAATRDEKKLIEMAVNHGADLIALNKEEIISSGTRLQVLIDHKDLLLNEKTANLFLEMAICCLPKNQEKNSSS